MTILAKQEWQKKHLKRQARLVWLIQYHLISEQLAEKLDKHDNDLQTKLVQKI